MFYYYGGIMFEIDILNINKFVKDFELEEVTSSNIYRYGSREPDEDGLVSYKIFGIPGSDERKTKYAYIDLGDKFVHPHVFKVLISIKQSLGDLILGLDDFYYKDGNVFRVKGEVPKDAEAVGNGPAFLYKIYDKLKIHEVYQGEAKTSKERYKFLSLLKKDEIFIDKFLVIPAYYRDVDLSKSRKNEINIMYAKLINLASFIKANKSSTSFFNFSSAHKQLQETLIELYDYFVDKFGGTKSFVHESVIGKNIDYSARLVISAPEINSESVDSMKVKFNKSILPMGAAIKVFTPFIVYGMRTFIRDYIQMGLLNYVDSRFVGMKEKDFYNISPEDLAIKMEDVRLRKYVKRVSVADNIDGIINTDYINNLIDLYYESKEHRFDYFFIPLDGGISYPIFRYTLTEDSENVKEKIMHNTNINNINDDKEAMSENRPFIKTRFLTLIEIFYEICMKMIRDKHIYITRYPVEDFHNIYPNKFYIDAYNRTTKVTIRSSSAVSGTTTYNDYPDVRYGDINKIDVMFTDTLRLFPAYLKALNADFDGDMCSVQGVYSHEANLECNRYIKSKLNVVNISGNTVRKPTSVMYHTIYSLTRE